MTGEPAASTSTSGGAPAEVGPGGASDDGPSPSEQVDLDEQVRLVREWAARLRSLVDRLDSPVTEPTAR